jgi:exonuclease III
MKYRVKADEILTLQPDIVVVPECENPERLKFGMFTDKPNDILWFGENENKGLGVFSYSNFKFKVHDWYNPNFRMIVPIHVSNGETEFTLFAVWANNPDEPEFQYVGQVWKAINYYDKYLASEKVIFLGDFNSNTIWDKPKRIGNHSTVVDFLEQKEIFSLYHKFFNEKQGEETQPTLFMYRHVDKPYHIDYCFASRYFYENFENLEIGKYDKWSTLSDHMPVIIEFKLKKHKP